MRTQSGFVPVCFALAALASMPASKAVAAIDVTIIRPSPQVDTITGPASDGRFLVEALVSSTFELATVTVRGNGPPINMFPGCVGTVRPPGCTPGWETNVLFGFYAFQIGPNQLVVDVVDAFGNTGSASKTLHYLPPPALTVVQPVELAVATPWLDVEAVCQDVVAQPCTSVSVRVQNGPTLLDVAGGIDHRVDLSGYDRQKVTLEIVGVGSTGSPAVVARVVYVESDPRWEEVDRVPGVIEAANDDLILYQPSEYVMRQLDRVSRVDSELEVIQPQTETLGLIAVAGSTALLSISSAFGGLPSLCGGPFRCLFAYRSGMVTSLGLVEPNRGVVAAGDFAIWRGGTQLSLLDGPTGAITAISNDASGPFGDAGDVAPNGDVVLRTTAGELHRHRNGVTTPLVVTGSNQNPRTDGINVAYEKVLPNSWREIWLHTAAGEDELLGEAEVAPYFGHTLNNGFTGFNHKPSGGVQQVWRRDPGGTLSQLTFYNAASFIQSLGPGGEIVFTTSAFPGRLCFIEAGGGPVQVCDDIGSAEGTPFYIGEQLHMALGGSLFAVHVPEPDVWLLQCAGLVGLTVLSRHRQRKSVV